MFIPMWLLFLAVLCVPGVFDAIIGVGMLLGLVALLVASCGALACGFIWIAHV